MSNTVEFSILGRDKFSRTMAGMRSSVNDIARDLIKVGAVITASMGFAGKTLIDVGKKTENLKLRMGSLLGSVAEGNRVFADMAEFAGKVPFSYEGIMESATQLSGVLKGGAAEIKATMPLIADLAAVSGLSIQQTTDQIARMYSAGAGAADLFREKGITAMLGFKSGVATTAEETKEKIIAAFNDSESKFRGAALKMATTWDGVMSMIGDKWFNIRAQIADAGVFNYFKALATVIDQLMGEALDNTKKNADVWANSIIDGIRSVVDAVGFMANMFRGIEVVWEGLKVVFANFAIGIVESIKFIDDGWRQLASIIPGVDLSPVREFDEILISLRNTTKDLTDNLSDLAEQPMPSEQIEEFRMKVEEAFIGLQELSAETNAQIADTTNNFVDTTDEALVHLQERTDEWLVGLNENSQTFIDSFFGMVEGAVDSLAEGITSVILEGKKVADVFKNIAKQVLTQFLTMLIKMGIQRLILSALNISTVTTEAGVAGAKAVGLAGANMFASWAAAPWPISLGAPAAAAAAVTGANASLLVGGAIGKATGTAITAAHGGLDFVPSEQTMLLDRGERILSPNQNKDLTNFLGGGEGGGGGVVIENLSVHIMENATNAEAFLNMDDFQVREVVAGPIIEALNTLDDQGIRPVFAERTGE